jgi:hypothetical protein
MKSSQYSRYFFNAVAMVALSGGALSSALAADCAAGFSPTAPDNAFEVREDGTVVDLARGLMWKQCVEGLSGASCDTGTLTAFADWGAGLDHAAAQSFAGYSDWRVPNLKELASIVESCRSSPAINTTAFPGTPALLTMTSSPTAASGGNGFWIVNFAGGISNTRSRINMTDVNVRLVRDFYIAGRFESTGADGEQVRDRETGLVWKRCYEGQSWNSALAICTGTATRIAKDNIEFYAPPSGYRLPLLEELQTLVVCSSGQRGKLTAADGECLGDYVSPAMVTTAFPSSGDYAGDPEPVWTASFMQESTFAWPLRYVVEFGSGAIVTEVISPPDGGYTATRRVRLLVEP